MPLFHYHCIKRGSIYEVEKIKILCKIIRNSGEKDYVILTPYKKQVSKLFSELPVERNELKILTVHGSQGREWENVILSVVDTYDKWFVDSNNLISKGLNLINTAISRTKKNLFIVCDVNYWRNLNDQLITDLIKSGKEFKL